MMGVEKIDPYLGQNNHAHRKIQFRYVNENGREAVLTCDVRLSTNHKFVGINFWQQFIGCELIQSRFFLLDHRGKLLWQPPTEELQNKNKASEINPFFPGIPWYNRARVDNRPVEYFMISNDGHLFLTHGCFLPGRNPKTQALYDKFGKLIRDFGPSSIEFAIFSQDGTRLITKKSDSSSDVFTIIRSSDGEILWEPDPETTPSVYSSINTSSDGKRIVYCSISKQSNTEKAFVLLEEFDDCFTETRISLDTESSGIVKKFGDVRLATTGGMLHDVEFKSNQQPSLLKEFKMAYYGLSDPIARDSKNGYYFCVGNSFKLNSISGETEGFRLLLILDSQLNPVAHAKIHREFSCKRNKSRFLKNARVILDEKIGLIYLITKTEFVEFQFSPLFEDGGE
jgi:hypothetical protein